MKTYSQEDILQFLNKMAQEGRMPENTASAQKAAVSKIFKALDEKELPEGVDVDELIRRFQIKAKTELQSDSLRIYGTRFKSAFNGFLKWNMDPSNYKPKTRRGRPLKNPCHDVRPPLCKDTISQPMTSAGISSQLNAASLVKYPLITASIRGSLEIPEELSKSDIDRLLPLVTEIIKAHGRKTSPLSEKEENDHDNV
ncbi:MAG: hypothetical protein A3C55_06425 [Gammaproteobacteria bacterium RIFCSPHIGHO2_02_FULL_42_13]|nr:MAG: hypothetical protein A3C55_06425 [Gammaproteobacteria bacterium RIFCSPHIGHO2_02_FULL_42_13]